MNTETIVPVVKEDFSGSYFTPDDCPIARAIRRHLKIDYVYCTRDAAFADQTKYKLLANFKEPYTKASHSSDVVVASMASENSIIRLFKIIITTCI